MKIKAVGAYSAKQPLEPMDITRREPGPHDVKIEIAYCGVCHSDLHQVRSEWAGTVYPCVPGQMRLTLHPYYPHSNLVS